MTTAGQPPDPESVDQLLEILYRLTDDERTRGQSLDAKTSTLAGFAGATLAITATLGAALFERDLGPIGPALQALFALTMATLAAAATLAVGGVLQPQRHLSIAMDEIREFGGFPAVAAPKIEIQGNMLVTLISALEGERRINARKARLTQWAARGLIGGYLAVAVMAVIFAVT